MVRQRFQLQGEYVTFVQYTFPLRFFPGDIVTIATVGLVEACPRRQLTSYFGGAATARRYAITSASSCFVNCVSRFSGITDLDVAWMSSIWLRKMMSSAFSARRSVTLDPVSDTIMPLRVW